MERSFRVFMVFLVCFVFLTASTPIITANNNSSSNSISSGVDKHVYYVSPQGNNKNNDGSLDKPFQTIKKAVETCKDGDEIRLMDGEYNGDYVDIYKSITITGLNKDKNNIKTGLYIGSNVIIQNCTLKNHNDKPIINDAFLTVSNCNFKDNRLEWFNGSAIRNYGNLIVENSDFNHNRFRADLNNWSYDICGGAIFNANTATIKNCTFNSNTAPTGGAIYNAGTLTVEDSGFNGNPSHNRGGAIFNTNTATIKNCKFNNNYAEDYGGAICNLNTATIKKCKFNNNQGDDDGGAIYNAGALTVEDSVFNGNHASDYSGAIYNKGILNVRDDAFTRNTAKEGGAIYSKNKLNVTRTIFEDNQAKCGCAVEVKGKNNNNIQNSTFLNNGVIEKGQGGAVYICKDTEVNINYCNFIGNKAKHGSAFYIRKYSSSDLRHNYWADINGLVLSNPLSLMDISTKASIVWSPVETEKIKI